MNLIQLGITASRANRGKSVKRSIAQRMVRRSYERNWGLVSLIRSRDFCPPFLPFTLKPMFASNQFGKRLESKVMIAKEAVLG